MGSLLKVDEKLVQNEQRNVSNIPLWSIHTVSVIKKMEY